MTLCPEPGTTESVCPDLFSFPRDHITPTSSLHSFSLSACFFFLSFTLYFFSPVQYISLRLLFSSFPLTFLVTFCLGYNLLLKSSSLSSTPIFSSCDPTNQRSGCVQRKDWRAGRTRGQGREGKADDRGVT